MFEIYNDYDRTRLIVNDLIRLSWFVYNTSFAEENSKQTATSMKHTTSSNTSVTDDSDSDREENQQQGPGSQLELTKINQRQFQRTKEGGF